MLYTPSDIGELTHWGIAAVLHTFLTAFSCVKIIIFWLELHWSLSIRAQLKKSQHWFKLKGSRMVAHALWKSEACRLCLGQRPCTSHWRVQGRSQGTTLSVSDLHNAPATILNLFYNMEYDKIRKIRQHMTWIEADIPGINLTPNRYNALAPVMSQ